MTATDETIGEAPVGGRAEPRREDRGADDVAEAAARDVARLLDRRGLREIVALAHRVLRESTRLATSTGPRPDDIEGLRCTLRQHERSTRRGAAGRAVDDDRT
jgi:hypothetical protein